MTSIKIKNRLRSEDIMIKLSNIPIISVLALLAVVLFVSSCSLTGNVVANDQCSTLLDTAKDNCYSENGKCSKVENQAFRDNCVAGLAKIKNDEKVCSLIVSDKTKGYCLAQLAEINDNRELCSKIEDTYWKDNCNYELGIKDNKANYCALVSNSIQRDECYGRVAIATNDKVVCEYFTDSKRDFCLLQIALNLEDVQTCQELSKPMTRDVCRKRVAIETKDRSLCNLIGFTPVREECFRFV